MLLKKFSWLSSLKSRLFGLVIFAMSPIIILLIYNSYEMYRQDSTQARDEALRLAKIIAKNQENIIAHTAEDLRLISLLPELQKEDLAGCDQIFTTILQQHPLYKTVGISDNSGHVLAFNGDKQTNISHKTFFIKVIQDKKFSYGDYEANEKKSVLCLGYPLFNEEKEIKRVVFACLDLAAVIKSTTETDLPPDTTFSLRDIKGNLLFRYPNGDKWSGKYLPETSVFKAVQNSNGEGVDESVGLDGKSRIFGFTSIKGVNNQIFVLAGLSKDYAYRRTTENLLHNFLTILLLIFLVTVLVYKAGELFILKQVRQLVATTEKVAAGNLNVRNGPNYVYGEIGQLAKAFDKMLDTIKQKNEQICQTESKFRTIFNSSNDVIFVNDIKTGNVLDANQKVESVFGYTQEEIKNVSLDILIAKRDLQSYKQGLTLIKKAAQGEPQLFEWLCKNKQDNLFWVEVNLIRTNIQGQDCLLATIRNINERKRFEQEMARLDRLHIVGEMAAGIAHEVRNPMTTVRGFSQMLKGKKEFSQYKEYFSLIIDELDRANYIISEFLSLARNKPTNLEVKNLNTIISALYPLIKADALNNDKMVELMLTQIPDLILDEKEIRQVILNLTRNGLEAMTAGKKLTISTYTKENEVILSVKDEGPGISQEVLNKIGTPFYTTKAQGTGLGLALCYSIAARHKANIQIETGLGGTIFSVRFKVAPLN